MSTQLPVQLLFLDPILATYTKRCTISSLTSKLHGEQTSTSLSNWLRSHVEDRLWCSELQPIQLKRERARWVVLLKHKLSIRPPGEPVSAVFWCNAVSSWWYELRCMAACHFRARWIQFFGHTKNVLSQAGALTGNENQVEGSPSWHTGGDWTLSTYSACSAPRMAQVLGILHLCQRRFFSNILNSFYLKLFDY